MTKRPTPKRAKKASQRPTKAPSKARPPAAARTRDGFANLRQLLGIDAGRALHELPRNARPRGLRLAIESERGITLPALRQHLRQVYGNDVEVSRIFPRYEAGVDIPSLQDHYFAVIPGLDAGHLLVNPFDVGYAALKKGVVKGAEPDIHPLSAPAPCYDQNAQVHEDRRWSLKVMNVGTAWDKLANAGKDRGGGIRIAHLDTGVTFHTRIPDARFDHGAAFDFARNIPDAIDPLPPRTAPGDVPGHGTMTSSVLIALDSSPGQDQMSGVAPEATVVPVRVTRSVIIAPFGELAQGLDHAWNNSCSVVSISLGGVAGRPTDAALRNCYTRGLLVCCAAGQCQPLVLYPAISHYTVACGGSRLREDGSGGQSESKWSPAAIGPIDIAAPAEKVWVAEATSSDQEIQAGITHAGTAADPFDAVGAEEGTSFAAPAIAAIGALWLRFNDSKSLLDRYRHRRPLNDVFREILKDTARSPNGWHHATWGPGIVDAGRVVDAPLPPAGPLLSNVDYLLLHDQDDDLETWCRMFWDLPRDAVMRVLQDLLGAADDADLRQRLHQFNMELMWLVTQDADRLSAMRQAIQAQATDAANRVAAAAQSLAQQASNKLRSLLP